MRPQPTGVASVASAAPAASRASRRAPARSRPTTSVTTAAAPTRTGATNTPACRLAQRTTAARNQAAARRAAPPPRSSSASIAASAATAPASEKICGRSTNRSRPTNAAAASARAPADSVSAREGDQQDQRLGDDQGGKAAVREESRGAGLREPGGVEVWIVGRSERIEVAPGEAVPRPDLLPGLEVEKQIRLRHRAER